MLKHGGRLREAARRYSIPLSDWIDLSTGVNPENYPVPDIPVSCWNRLPEDDDGLLEAAQKYYGCHSLLPLAGSQAGIQSLPVIRSQLFPDSRTVAIPAVGYREHGHAWAKQGYTVIPYDDLPSDEVIEQVDVLLVINPNNPTGRYIDQQQLLSWHKQLSARNSWLVIDEAFMDCTPELGLSSQAPLPGLVILRSVGKFFGLAGIRAGFLLAESEVLNLVQEHLGPWSLAGPSREICRQALLDRQWQTDNRQQVLESGARLKSLLQNCFNEVQGTPLFVTVRHSGAEGIHDELCREGIFTRLLDEKNGLRFGLPADADSWQRLESALARVLNRD